MVRPEAWLRVKTESKRTDAIWKLSYGKVEVLAMLSLHGGLVKMYKKEVIRIPWAVKQAKVRLSREVPHPSKTDNARTDSKETEKSALFRHIEANRTAIKAAGVLSKRKLHRPPLAGRFSTSNSASPFFGTFTALTLLHCPAIRPTCGLPTLASSF